MRPTFASLALGAEADAATRYAAPGGTGPAASCPQANPCSLDDAVEDATVTAGDEVVVGTGTYLVTGGLVIDDGISVGGAPSAVPTIVATTPGEAAIAVDASGAELHDLTLVQLAGDPAVRLLRGTVDRVTAESDGAAACELGVTGAGVSLIRDSVCWSGPASSAGSAVVVGQSGAGTRNAVMRNVTAWASAPGGTGIELAATGGGTAAIDARNVIASGDGADIEATADAGSSALLTLTTSNFEDVTTAGAGTTTVTPASQNANQVSEPALVDPDSGNFEEVIGSPTIDAGSVGTSMGDRDLDGAPRVQGPLPDIGADERDGTPPRTTIESGPAAAVKSGRVTFAFRADDSGATFACRVDDAPYEPCSSPFTTSTLSQGDHVFAVRATDSAGNVEATPAERSFTVDKVIQGANVAARNVQRQRGRKLTLVVTVRAGELARVRATGYVRAGKRRFPVESRQTTLVAGGSAKLRLMPKDRRAGRKVSKALKRGDRVDAVLAATFIDLLGNRATSGEVDVRLRGGK